MITNEDRQDREDFHDERAVERRRDSLWLAAQARTAGTSIASPIPRAADLPDTPPPSRTARLWGDLAESTTPRQAAARLLCIARERRRGVEAMGAWEAAATTFHEAASDAARTYATAHLDCDGAGEDVWLGAFDILRGLAVRARAMSATVVAA